MKDCKDEFFDTLVRKAAATQAMRYANKIKTHYMHQFMYESLEIPCLDSQNVVFSIPYLVLRELTCQRKV